AMAGDKPSSSDEPDAIERGGDVFSELPTTPRIKPGFEAAAEKTPPRYVESDEFERIPTTPEAKPVGFKRRRTKVEFADAIEPMSYDVFEEDALACLEELSTLADELEFEVTTSELAAIDNAALVAAERFDRAPT